MPDQLIQVKAGFTATLMMILTVSLALFASWFVVRWYVGNTIAEYFHAEGGRMEAARMAVSLAPNDPYAHWNLGYITQRDSTPDQIPLVIAEYEKAVSLSPHDYRFWMDLGHALEQVGEFDKSEKALREAVKLAPSYAYPRWLLGNMLLRTERYTEAFAELRQASEANEEFQSHLFNLAWQVNKDDFDTLTASVGTAPEVRAQFAKYLLARGRSDEGLRLWNALTETEKRANRSAADSIISSLISASRYHLAVQVWNDVAPGNPYRAEPGHVIDGGFEENVGHGPGAVFGWQVQSAPEVQIGIDPGHGHSGSRSLRTLFQVRSRLDAINVSQLVPVWPNTTYDFECYVKTEKLLSAATPLVLIAEAANDSGLVASAPTPTGTNDWQHISLSFKTGPKSEAIRIRINRSSCVDSPVCPIFGTVWYDDFTLKPRK